LGSFVFELCSGQADKQTNKQTAVNILLNVFVKHVGLCGDSSGGLH